MCVSVPALQNLENRHKINHVMNSAPHLPYCTAESVCFQAVATAMSPIKSSMFHLDCE